MTSTSALLQAMEQRRSIYDLSPSSLISDARIHEIVNHVVKFAPSAFNMQSARIVVLLKDDHRKLWDLIREIYHATWPPATHAFLDGKIAEYQAAYGTALFYEDPATIKATIDSQPRMKAIAHLFPQWSEHSSGMHQYALWTALSAEGLGCNLQHYENIENRLSSEWQIPVEWKAKAQLVFGQPNGGPPRDKFATMIPLEQRVFVHGGETQNEAAH